MCDRVHVAPGPAQALYTCLLEVALALRHLHNANLAHCGESEGICSPPPHLPTLPPRPRPCHAMPCSLSPCPAWCLCLAPDWWRVPPP